MVLIEFAFLLLLLRAQRLSATCMEREDHIQRYLISSQPPFDNYYNISKAVYPSVDLPSLLIKITVTFLHGNSGSSNLTYLDGSSESPINGSTSNISKQTGANAPETTENKTTKHKFTWSASCLYVSGGHISLTSMNAFSLWAVWPNRRERQLHLTLPQFCGGFSSDTMIYFLSTLQDIAVAPHRPDPSLNTVECVIMGHGKAPHFAGLKQLFHGVCWCILCISLVCSQIASHWLIVQLKDWTEEEKNGTSKVAAVMLLSLFVFVLGLVLHFITWYCSTPQEDVYVYVFFGSVMIVLVRRVIWCIFGHYRSDIGIVKSYEYFKWFTLNEGHASEPSENAISFLLLYPAVFMAFHHLLWILLGIITEPFWGISVLVAVLSVSAAFFFLTCEFCESFPSNERTCANFKTLPFVTSLFHALGGFLAFLLLIFVLLAVAQSFLSESLVSTLVQNGLVFFSTLWLAYLKLHQTKKEAGQASDSENSDSGNNTTADLNLSGQQDDHELQERRHLIRD